MGDADTARARGTGRWARRRAYGHTEKCARTATKDVSISLDIMIGHRGAMKCHSYRDIPRVAECENAFYDFSGER